MAGPRATALRVTWLYISPDTGSQKVDKGARSAAKWWSRKRAARGCASTPTPTSKSNTATKDTPMVGERRDPPPISGWMEAKGVVEETTPNGDQILMGAAANQEAAGLESARPGQRRAKRAPALSPRCRDVSQLAARA